MNHSYRVERLCLGQCDSTGEAFPPTEKAVAQAFATLSIGVEQLLGSMPHSVSTVATRYTQDGLDIRVGSTWDSTTVRNLVASVVADLNVASPGLNLSVISRPAAAAAGAKAILVPTPNQASGLAVPDMLATASRGTEDSSESLRLAA